MARVADGCSLTQAAFTKLYTHWRRVARHEALDPYVRQVLIRTFIDDGRRGWWRRERPQETPVTPPPPMESAVAMTAGRRAVRRRATLAGGGVAAVMVAVTGLALNSGLHVSANGSQPWAGPPSAIGDPTKPTWPLDGDGQPQEDATARSGVPLRYHQAAVEGDSWGYSAHAAVARDDRTGRLLADVRTPGNGLPAEPCGLARTFWVTGGTCAVPTAGKVKVGVVTLPAGTDRVDQWAAYRHADGTVVFLSQSRSASTVPTSLKPLKSLPLAKQQHATLAADRRFHLN